MTAICAGLAGLAVLLLLRPPGGRSLTRLSVTTPGPRPPWTRRRAAWIGSGLLVVAATVGGVLAGAAGVVAAVSGGAVVVTGVRLDALRRRGRSATAARAEVAHACRLLAGQLRVGRIPAEALRIGAADCPVLAPASALLELGSDPVARWRLDAVRPGHDGLLVLARAWQVSTTTGAPLAPALERVSEALSEELAIERLVFGEVAAARATGKLMALLPLCGIGLGYLIGGRPLQFLVSGPIGWGCLLGGSLLAVAGVLWIDRLSRSVLESRVAR